MGVFLIMAMKDLASHSLPHARGGVSDFASTHLEQDMSSPRTWGCFSGHPALPLKELVFPTHVGVFLVDKAQLDT